MTFSNILLSSTIWSVLDTILEEYPLTLMSSVTSEKHDGGGGDDAGEDFCTIFFNFRPFHDKQDLHLAKINNLARVLELISGISSTPGNPDN